MAAAATYKSGVLISLTILLMVASLLGYYFWPESKLPGNKVVSRLVVIKSERKLQVYSGDALIKSYCISLGRVPVGKKQIEGDGKTPEGNYFISNKTSVASKFKGLLISYPNDADKKNALQKGLKPGGEILIHGLQKKERWIGKFQRWRDWTNGCIALTSSELDDLYARTPVGVPIDIMP